MLNHNFLADLDHFTSMSKLNRIAYTYAQHWKETHLDFEFLKIVFAFHLKTAFAILKDFSPILMNMDHCFKYIILKCRKIYHSVWETIKKHFTETSRGPTLQQRRENLSVLSWLPTFHILHLYYFNSYRRFSYELLLVTEESDQFWSLIVNFSIDLCQILTFLLMT